MPVEIEYNIKNIISDGLLDNSDCFGKDVKYRFNIKLYVNIHTNLEFDFKYNYVYITYNDVKYTHPLKKATLNRRGNGYYNRLYNGEIVYIADDISDTQQLMIDINDNIAKLYTEFQQELTEIENIIQYKIDLVKKLEDVSLELNMRVNDDKI
jgi:hypothetical protein